MWEHPGEGRYLSHSRQGKKPWPFLLPGSSGVRFELVFGLELGMDSLL